MPVGLNISCAASEIDKDLARWRIACIDLALADDCNICIKVDEDSFKGLFQCLRVAASSISASVRV